MKTLKVNIHFIEPFRVVKWHDVKDRNSAAFLRGYGFARWHNSNESGRPYITGTLVRSAVIHAAEQLLWSRNGEYHGEKCCPGEFEGNKAKVYRKQSAKRMRRRQTLSWNNGLKCCPENTKNPCLFCLLLGRFDEARACDEKHESENQKRYDVKFKNFDSHLTENVALAQVATPRIINRVDQEDGKAEDFLRIREIDHEICGVFSGGIHLSERAEKLEPFLRDVVALVDTIAGGLCWLEIEGEAADDKIDAGNKPASTGSPSLAKQMDGWAEDVQKAFERTGKGVHLRKIADVVRELRRDTSEKSFPTGHEDRLRKDQPHFIWDVDVSVNTKFRDWLPEKYREAQKTVLDWHRFCEKFGQALYGQAKKVAPEQFSSERPVGAGQAVQVTKPPIAELVRAGDAGLYEHLITGRLVAATPFFFGWSSGEDAGDQTSLRLLSDSSGRLRLPRSVLRGILRRDLKIAFNSGCRAELGHSSPCACPVCKLMRSITIKDSHSDYCKPPQIRHRIRLDPSTRTVAPGALFDMEVGPKGASFPFEMRIRNNNGTIAKEIKTVLSWWQNGDASFSGGAGTGKGRFTLEAPKVHTWDLSNDEQFQTYRKYAGGRRKGASINLTNLPEEVSPPEYLWKAVPISFSVISPFLTGDPIAALLDLSGTDAICYKSIYLDEDGKEREEYLLKSESFRGLLRAAVGRRIQNQSLLELEHEDCNCALCRIFGNQQEQGKIQVEDLVITSDVVEKTIDRVSIDRFTGGAKDKHKFDMAPIAGTPAHPIKFEGKIWRSTALSSEDRTLLEAALSDIHSGLYPFGGLGTIGLGWVAGDNREGTPPQVMQLADQSCEPALEKDHIYWPHYFLRFAESKVTRENEPPSHAYLDTENLYAGRLVCTLKTKTPLIIPDRADENLNAGENGDHKLYPFFQLSGQVCIPGSETKGMLSSLFEALTNSCLRVFDEKRRLSWRMEAKNLDQWKPGRIIEKQNGLYVDEMEEIRLPLYDNPDLLEKIKSIGKKGYYRTKQIKNKGKTTTKQGQPTRADKLINENAMEIRRILAAGIEDGSFIREVTWFRCYPHGMDSLALLEKPMGGFNQNKSYFLKDSETAYLKISGPNKLEIERLSSAEVNKLSVAEMPTDRVEVVHNDVSLDESTVNSRTLGSVERKRAIPKFEIINNGFKYIMKKRCERVFVYPPKSKRKRDKIHANVMDKFQQLFDEYDRNANKIPPVFRTRLPRNGELKDGDLIYFKRKFIDSGDVTDIIPVRISRIMDDHNLGEKIRGDVRPCIREILDDDIARSMKDQGLKSLFQHHPEGICPACALFGTGFYKGRVSFGFAFPREASDPQFLNDGNYITLPLLESPRPTWAMPRRQIFSTDTTKTPNKQKSDQGKASETTSDHHTTAMKGHDVNEDKGDLVPGRKFYVHHQGWKRVVENSPNENKTKNNRSVQAIAPEQEFTFEVRFENLRDWELGLLIYSLNLEPGMAHKLGMAKPLGFGSVDISVEKVISETSLDMNMVNDSALKKLLAFWGASDDGELRSKMKDLFQLLHYQQSDDIRVRYPALRKEDDPENKPGYVELGKDKGPFSPQARRNKITSIWSPWDSKPKEDD